MSRRIAITAELLQSFYERNILFRWNSPPPDNGKYGWLTTDMVVTLPGPITIEENAGIYRGPYRGLIGGAHSSGLVSMGSFSYSYSPLPHRMTVGRYCSISNGLAFLDSTHPMDTITSSAMLFRPSNHLYKGHLTDELRSYAAAFKIRPSAYPTIEHDVWIGANVTLAPHITLGTGSVVAANSLVTRDVAPYTVVGGNPAKVIKKRFDDDVIEQLLASQWWNYEPTELFAHDPRDIDGMIKRVTSGDLAPYSPRSVTLGEEPVKPAAEKPPVEKTPDEKSQAEKSPAETARDQPESAATSDEASASDAAASAPGPDDSGSTAV